MYVNHWWSSLRDLSGTSGVELTALGLVIVFRSIAPPSPITPTFEGAATAASCSLAEVAHCLFLTFLTEINTIGDHLR